MSDKELQRPRPAINQKRLWKEIRKVKNRKANEALYSLGCYCQGLERLVGDLESRIASLEKSRIKRQDY